MEEHPSTCLIIDMGETVLIAFWRPVGRTFHHIQFPISRVLRVMRDMGWDVVRVGPNRAGWLRVSLRRRTDQDADCGVTSRMRLMHRRELLLGQSHAH